MSAERTSETEVLRASMETNLCINQQYDEDATSVMACFKEATRICSKSLETDDFEQSEAAVSKFVLFLDSTCETALDDPENAIANRNAFELITGLHILVTSPSNQMLVDALSLELPKVVAKFAGVSDKCREVAEGIIDHLCSTCNPRDMFSALCGALDFLIKVYSAPNFFVPLFSGISIVFLCIKRHHYEQIKLAVPGILHVLEVVSSESSDEYKDSLRDLIHRVIGISSSIQTVCEKMVGQRKELLMALLGLYVLQVMVLISRTSLSDKILSNIYFVVQLSEFLPFCGLTYLGLITGHDVDNSTTMLLGEDDDQFMNCFPLIKHGASLAVIWGHISDDVAKAAREDFGAVKDKLQTCRTERWKALGMLRYMLSAPYHPWELKCHGIDFVLSITDGNISQSFEDDSDWLSSMPGLVSVMEAVELVIIYASDAMLRKKAFTCLKSVLADIPFSERFVVLKVLVTRSTFPSMVALLIDLAREEISMRNRWKFSQGDEKTLIEKIIPSSPFSNSDALDLVEFVLKPSKGGPPTLPEQSDAVLSALNLYRFLVMLESTGKTTNTGVLSSDNLHKAYNDWLLPLRTLVSGIQAENENDDDEFAVDTVCALNPLQLVLYHCLELVEVNMKKSAKS